MIGICVLERLAKPAVVGRVGVLAHEGVVDGLVAVENLPMHLALVVIPDPAARPWEDGLDRQQEAHLLRLEDAALRIDERDALAVEDEARLQLGRGQVIVDFAQPSDMLERRHAHESVAIWLHARRHPNPARAPRRRRSLRRAVAGRYPRTS